MRALICADAIGGLPSAVAGRALGRAFAASGRRVQVAVVPLAAGGPALQDALRELGRDDVVAEAPGEPGDASGFDRAATTAGLGQALLSALDAAGGPPGRLVLDLAASVAPDGGAGLLAALGASASGGRLDAGLAGLTGLDAVDLSPALRRLRGAGLVGVLPVGQASDLLLGLRGLASRRGRDAGLDPPSLLAADDGLARLARALGIEDAPGAGACGGAGLAILALGGVLTTGVGLCAEAAGLEATASRADIVVTGADTIGFADRGGPVVREVAALAERALRPCVAVAREVSVSARELRTFGIESAHPLGGEAEMDADELTRRASGVARTWTW